MIRVMVQNKVGESGFGLDESDGLGRGSENSWGIQLALGWKMKLNKGDDLTQNKRSQGKC